MSNAQTVNLTAELARWKARAIRAEKELDEICQCLRTHQNEAECELEKCGCCAASASELVADRMISPEELERRMAAYDGCQ